MCESKGPTKPLGAVKVKFMLYFCAYAVQCGEVRSPCAHDTRRRPYWAILGQGAHHRPVACCGHRCTCTLRGACACFGACMYLEAYKACASARRSMSTHVETRKMVNYACVG